jgi:cobalt/nickel transport protein
MIQDDRKVFLDPFVKACLIAGIVLLVAIFCSAYYMDVHKMEAGGTDDVVNDMAGQVAQAQHHPLVDLPGDTQVGAFSVANFFVGLIVGYTWRKIYYDTKKEDVEAQYLKPEPGGAPEPGGGS